MESFYATVTSFEFVLMGLWWNVVQARPEWMRNPQQQRLARAVYLSFLIPGVMSLAAQLGQDSKLLWQAVFFVAAVTGGATTILFLRQTRGSGGWFRRHYGWVIAAYAGIAVFAVRPDLALNIGLQPLQVEGVLVSLLVFFGVSFAWELVTETHQADASSASRDATHHP
jgi:hypothetical protein